MAAGRGALDWPQRSRTTNTQQRIEGYDPYHYMDMAGDFARPGLPVASRPAVPMPAQVHHPEVNKLINLPTLKDHQSAGVTLALKNLSHGLVNKRQPQPFLQHVERVRRVSIPAVVSLPVIRNKTVLPHSGRASKDSTTAAPAPKLDSFGNIGPCTSQRTLVAIDSYSDGKR